MERALTVVEYIKWVEDHVDEFTLLSVNGGDKLVTTDDLMSELTLALTLCSKLASQCADHVAVHYPNEAGTIMGMRRVVDHVRNSKFVAQALREHLRERKAYD